MGEVSRAVCLWLGLGLVFHSADKKMLNASLCVCAVSRLSVEPVFSENTAPLTTEWGKRTTLLLFDTRTIYYVI